MKTIKDRNGTPTASEALRRDVERRMTAPQRELLLAAHSVSTDGDRIVFVDGNGSVEERLRPRTPPEWALEIVRRVEERAELSAEQRDALAGVLLTALHVCHRETRESLAGHYTAKDVEFMVCLALDHDEISEGRAVEILGVDRLRVRELYDEHRAQLEQERTR